MNVNLDNEFDRVDNYHNFDEYNDLPHTTVSVTRMSRLIGPNADLPKIYLPVKTSKSIFRYSELENFVDASSYALIHNNFNQPYKGLVVNTKEKVRNDKLCVLNKLHLNPGRNFESKMFRKASIIGCNPLSHYARLNKIKSQIPGKNNSFTNRNDVIYRGFSQPIQRFKKGIHSKDSCENKNLNKSKSMSKTYIVANSKSSSFIKSKALNPAFRSTINAYSENLLSEGVKPLKNTQIGNNKPKMSVGQRLSQTYANRKCQRLCRALDKKQKKISFTHKCHHVRKLSDYTLGNINYNELKFKRQHNRLKNNLLTFYLRDLNNETSRLKDFLDFDYSEKGHKHDNASTTFESTPKTSENTPLLEVRDKFRDNTEFKNNFEQLSDKSYQFFQNNFNPKENASKSSLTNTDKYTQFESFCLKKEKKDFSKKDQPISQSISSKPDNENVQITEDIQSHSTKRKEFSKTTYPNLQIEPPSYIKLSRNINDLISNTETTPINSFHEQCFSVGTNSINQLNCYHCTKQTNFLCETSNDLHNQGLMHYNQSYNDHKHCCLLRCQDHTHICPYHYPVHGFCCKNHPCYCSLNVCRCNSQPSGKVDYSPKIDNNNLTALDPLPEFDEFITDNVNTIGNTCNNYAKSRAPHTLDFDSLSVGSNNRNQFQQASNTQNDAFNNASSKDDILTALNETCIKNNVSPIRIEASVDSPNANTFEDYEQMRNINKPLDQSGDPTQQNSNSISNFRERLSIHSPVKLNLLNRLCSKHSLSDNNFLDSKPIDLQQYPDDLNSIFVSKTETTNDNNSYRNLTNINSQKSQGTSSFIKNVFDKEESNIVHLENQDSQFFDKVSLSERKRLLDKNTFNFLEYGKLSSIENSKSFDELSIKEDTFRTSFCYNKKELSNEPSIPCINLDKSNMEASSESKYLISDSRLLTKVMPGSDCPFDNNSCRISSTENTNDLKNNSFKESSEIKRKYKYSYLDNRKFYSHNDKIVYDNHLDNESTSKSNRDTNQYLLLHNNSEIEDKCIQTTICRSNLNTLNAQIKNSSLFTKSDSKQSINNNQNKALSLHSEMNQETQDEKNLSFPELNNNIVISSCKSLKSYPDGLYENIFNDYIRKNEPKKTDTSLKIVENSFKSNKSWRGNSTSAYRNSSSNDYNTMSERSFNSSKSNVKLKHSDDLNSSKKNLPQASLTGSIIDTLKKDASVSENNTFEALLNKNAIDGPLCKMLNSNRFKAINLQKTLTKSFDKPINPKFDRYDYIIDSKQSDIKFDDFGPDKALTEDSISNGSSTHKSEIFIAKIPSLEKNITDFVTRHSVSVNEELKSYSAVISTNNASVYSTKCPPSYKDQVVLAKCCNCYQTIAQSVKKTSRIIDLEKHEGKVPTLNKPEFKYINITKPQNITGSGVCTIKQWPTSKATSYISFADKYPTVENLTSTPLKIEKAYLSSALQKLKTKTDGTFRQHVIPNRVFRLSPLTNEFKVIPTSKLIHNTLPSSSIVELEKSDGFRVNRIKSSQLTMHSRDISCPIKSNNQVLSASKYGQYNVYRNSLKAPQNIYNVSFANNMMKNVTIKDNKTSKNRVPTERLSRLYNNTSSSKYRSITEPLNTQSRQKPCEKICDFFFGECQWRRKHANPRPRTHLCST